MRPGAWCKSRCERERIMRNTLRNRQGNINAEFWMTLKNWKINDDICGWCISYAHTDLCDDQKPLLTQVAAFETSHTFMSGGTPGQRGDQDPLIWIPSRRSRFCGSPAIPTPQLQADAQTYASLSRSPLAVAAVCGLTEVADRRALSFLVGRSVSAVSDMRAALEDTADHSGPRYQALQRPSAVWMSHQHLWFIYISVH